MNYLSVCSGIEAASCAWHPLGWRALAFSEIEKFPSAVLAHRYPEVPNLGDMTKYQEWPDAAVDVLVGGTPCQSFSVAGLRKGLADPRGNLMLTFGAIAAKHRPEWLVWENVPGVLSSDGGRDFGTFLGMLAELGYGFAYRVLDAQYFGVAQRRRRVFVVANARDWRRAAAVLFERHSLSGHPAPSRETGEDPAKCLTRGACQRYDAETETMIPVALMDERNVTSPANRASCRVDGAIPTMHEKPFAIAFGGQMSVPQVDVELSQTLQAKNPQAVAFQSSQSGVRIGDVHATLDSNNGSRRHNGAVIGTAVRRLTPRECERLQGFPDDYTLIPGWSADGPRYKALGNSMAVPVMRWIGERIQAVSEVQSAQEAA